MSNSDCQENIKEPIEHGPAMAVTAAEKPIDNGLLISTIAATVIRMFLGLRAMSAGNIIHYLRLRHWYGCFFYRYGKVIF